MSLIPSESYSFPDHFSKTVSASRKPKNIEPEPEMIEPVRKRPALVALPNPKPLAIAKPQPVAKPEPVLEPEPLVFPEPGIGLEPMAESDPFGELKPLPKPEVVVAKETPMPALKITPRMPNPALRRAAAPPPRISEPPVRKIALPPTLKPKVRWNNRAPAMDPTPKANNGNGADHFPEESLMPPAENVIQMKPQPFARVPRMMPRSENFPVAPPVKPAPVLPPVRPAPAPPPVNSVSAPPPKPSSVPPPAKPVSAPAPPKPIPVAKQRVQPVKPAPPVRENPRPVVNANPQTDFFEAFAQSGNTVAAKRRRKARMRRFIVYESIAFGILLPLAILGLSLRPENVVLHWMVNIVTIAAAFAAALIPIFLFAVTPTLPELER